MPTAPRDLTADSKPEEIVLSWTAPAYTGTPILTRYEYQYTSVVTNGEPVWPQSSDAGFWAPTSDPASPSTATELTLPAAGVDKILETGTVYHFRVRAVNEHGESISSNSDDGIATAVKAGWAFEIETLDGDNVVTSLVAGETELTLRFTATYTVDTADKGKVTSLWADFATKTGTLLSAVPSATSPQEGWVWQWGNRNAHGKRKAVNYQSPAHLYGELHVG